MTNAFDWGTEDDGGWGNEAGGGWGNENGAGGGWGPQEDPDDNLTSQLGAMSVDPGTSEDFRKHTYSYLVPYPSQEINVGGLLKILPPKL